MVGIHTWRKVEERRERVRGEKSEERDGGRGKKRGRERERGLR